MQNLDSNVVQQGSEASFEYTERLTQAVQHEAQKPVEPDQADGASKDLQWLDGKKKQMDEFLKKLEQEGIQRNKFNAQAEIQ